MTILKNYRHEKFALAIVKGLNQTKAAIYAGYKESRARQTGKELVTYSDIIERIKELNQAIETPAIMDVRERKEKLSEIARANLTDFVIDGEPELTKDTPNKGAAAEFYKKHTFSSKGDPVLTKAIKLHNPMTAMDILNKMGGDYPPSKVEIEPGKNLGAALEALLARLRGYEKKE